MNDQVVVAESSVPKHSETIRLALDASDISLQLARSVWTDAGDADARLIALNSVEATIGVLEIVKSLMSSGR